jgi:hypothetical protein
METLSRTRRCCLPNATSPGVSCCCCCWPGRQALPDMLCVRREIVGQVSHNPIRSHFWRAVTGVVRGTCLRFPNEVRFCCKNATNRWRAVLHWLLTEALDKMRQVDAQCSRCRRSSFTRLSPGICRIGLSRAP